MMLFAVQAIQKTLAVGMVEQCSELLATDGSGKVVGTITSAVQSPREGEVLALAYVRRGVDEVLLGEQTVAVPEDLAGVR